MSVVSEPDIRRAINEQNLLTHWVPESIKGASYDVRAGNVAILIEPEPPKGQGRLIGDN